MRVASRLGAKPAGAAEMMSWVKAVLGGICIRIGWARGLLSLLRRFNARPMSISKEEAIAASRLSLQSTSQERVMLNMRAALSSLP
jgi:hypothetical protein